MTDSRPSQNGAKSEVEITLGLLSAVEENNSLTQRSLAGDLGIALGLANAYLKRCVKKGFIKVAQVPANRYAYYLTPQGFAEKSRLTAEFLSQSFNFFRITRTQCEGLFDHCARRGWTNVALVGVGDLGEIATLCARDHPIRLVGFVDDGTAEKVFAGLPVVPDFSGLDAVDAAIITHMGNPQDAFEAAVKALPPGRVLAPEFLRVSARPPAPRE